MYWKNILILCAVIAAIHIVLIAAFSGGCKSKSKAVDTVQTEGDNQQTEGVSEVSPPPPPPPPVKKAKPSAGWNYGKKVQLPKKLAALSENARSGVLVDLNSRQVIWEKNARKAVPVASLTKLMTAIIVAEELESNPKFLLKDLVEISKSASETEGYGFAKGEVLTVQDLIACMMIRSTNDAAVQLAEMISGNESNFVKKMNDRALELGMPQVKFTSASGLPVGKKRENSFATAENIVDLCAELMQFDSVMQFCGKSSAKLSNGKEIHTTNGLLKHPTKARPNWRKVPGLIGFKTGFTNAAGCCLAFGVTRNGRTIIGCVTGFPSSADRERFCNDLIEWAYKR